jgi:hypothetical protein
MSSAGRYVVPNHQTTPSRNPRATRNDDTGHHEATRDDTPMFGKPAQEAKDDISGHRTTHALGGMESNKDLR